MQRIAPGRYQVTMDYPGVLTVNSETYRAMCEGRLRQFVFQVRRGESMHVYSGVIAVRLDSGAYRFNIGT